MTYYNMTMWILSGNGINFSIANHWHCLREIPAIIVECQKQHYNLQLCLQIHCKCFIVVECFKTDLNMPMVRVWGSASRTQHPLLRGATWCNNGSSTWNGSHFEHHFSYVEWRKLTLMKWYWKCHVIIVIMIKTNLSGFVVTMHSGLCGQYIKSLSLMASGFNFLFHTYPCACDNKPLQNQS